VIYVDGLVAVVPTADRTAFRDHAQAGASREHGALAAVGCRGDDVPDGEAISLPQAAQYRPGETVRFSWFRRPFRDIRDEAMPKIMSPPDRTVPISRRPSMASA
jgi:uncharacterized protein YbaA (DUF1428 family)